MGVWEYRVRRGQGMGTWEYWVRRGQGVGTWEYWVRSGQGVGTWKYRGQRCEEGRRREGGKQNSQGGKKN